MRGIVALVAVGAGSCGSGSALTTPWLDGRAHRKVVELRPPGDTELVDFPVAIQVVGDPELASGARPDGTDYICECDGRRATRVFVFP